MTTCETTMRFKVKVKNFYAKTPDDAADLINDFLVENGIIETRVINISLKRDTCIGVRVIMWYWDFR